MERSRKHKRVYDARPYTLHGEYDKLNEISEGKKHYDDIRKTCKFKVQIWETEISGQKDIM